MIVCFFLFIILVFSKIFINNKKSPNNLRAYLYFIVFIILQYARIYCQQYFPDIPNYYDLFEDVSTLSEWINIGTLYKGIYDVDTGFLILTSIIKSLNSSYGFYLFIISLIEIWALYVFSKKYNVSFIDFIIICFALSYTTFQIGMLRQALAFVILLIALTYIDRTFLYIIISCLGLSFHKSYLICFILVFFKKNIPLKFWYIFFACSTLIYLLQIDLVPNIFQVLMQEDFNGSGRINHYATTGVENNLFGIGFFDRLLQGVLLIFIYRNLLLKNLSNKKYHLLFALGMFSIILQMSLFSIPTITSRLRYYFQLFPILFFSEYIREYSHRNNKFIFGLILAAYLLLFLYTQTAYLS